MGILENYCDLDSFQILEEFADEISDYCKQYDVLISYNAMCQNWEYLYNSVN